MTSSVDGLISGLNTTSIISQLMQGEAAGQTALKQKMSDQQRSIAAYQSINLGMAGLATAAKALTGEAWSAATASSSSDAVTATATAGAGTGSYTFDVTRLAAAATRTVAVPPTGPAATGGTLTLTVGGTAHSLAVTDRSAAGVAAAINDAGLGVAAAVLHTEQGTVLQLSATRTGVAHDFSVAGLAGPATVLVAAADAQLTVGDPAAGGYTIASDSNTFTGALPGLTLTAGRLQAGVTVTVRTDVAGLAGKVQNLVTAANSALSTIDTQAALGTGGTTAGPLAGDYLARQVAQNVLSAVSNGDPTYGSYAQLGVQLDRNGRLTFDAAAFTKAYTADPAAVQAALSKGLAPAVTGVTTQASTDLGATINNGDSAVKTLTDQIADWDVRLHTRQLALQTQFTNMEVALGKLRDQSNWLAGQISSLGTGK